MYIFFKEANRGSGHIMHWPVKPDSLQNVTWATLACGLVLLGVNILTYDYCKRNKQVTSDGQIAIVGKKAKKNNKDIFYPLKKWALSEGQSSLDTVQWRLHWYKNRAKAEIRVTDLHCCWLSAQFFHLMASKNGHHPSCVFISVALGDC